MISTPNILPASRKAISRASETILEGDLVAFPTETVYGLGADATNDSAVAGIFEAKNRPSFNPLIVHIKDIEMASTLGHMNENALKLARKFWPGPLTLTVPRLPNSPASLLVSAGLDTIALRVPDHPVALALLAEVGRPIAAPSANMSGTVSPTTAQHVAESLGNVVSFILDGGPCKVGIESTIVLVDNSGVRVLRPGGVSQEELEAVLGESLLHRNALGERPLSPGQLARHYAPKHRIRLNVTDPQDGEVLLAFGPKLPDYSGRYLNLSPIGDLREAAANLFAMMREMDNFDSEGIAVMIVPETGLGVAINDRLRRAATQPDGSRL